LAAELDASAPRVSASRLPSLDELSATRERPLFSPSRRPPEPAPEQPEPEPARAPVATPTNFPYQLVGIVRGPDTNIAVFRKSDAASNEEGQPAPAEKRLSLGDKLDEWTIDEIAEHFVILHGDAKRVRLRLYKETDPSIQIGRPGGADGEHAGERSSEDGADKADNQSGTEPTQKDQIDEDIAPTSTPKIAVPPPRKVVRPPPPQQAKQPKPKPPSARPPPPPQQPRR
jgi:general secretion pathway protein N